MFEYEDKICRKIKEAGCLDEKELQAVEISLRLTACHDMLLNEALGLDIDKSKQFNFGLNYAVHKNTKNNR